jgi:hypothetical protein
MSKILVRAGNRSINSKKALPSDAYGVKFRGIKLGVAAVYNTL